MCVNQQVIGDKKGDKVAKQLSRLENMDVLKELQQVVNIRFKFLHVVRNPYDNVATILLEGLGKRVNASFEEKVIEARLYSCTLPAAPYS